MFKRFGIFGLCLLAVFVTSVMAAASASAAAPEIGRCVVQPKGNFKDAGCEKGEFPKQGKWEWLPGPGPKNKFISAEEKSTLQTVGNRKIVCTHDTDSGEYTGPKTDVETILFTGCKLTGLGVNVTCSSPGLAAGEITTNPLASELGFISKPTEVGMDLKPLFGSTFAEFECGGIRIVVEGSVIARMTPISKMTLIFKEKFKATAGIQKPEKFEGGPKDTLICTGFEDHTELVLFTEQCGFTSLGTITNEEKLEINEAV